MIAIVCVDKRMGILFNKRRVSSDKVLNAWLTEYVGNNKFRMREYSKGLFPDNPNVIVSDKYLDEAEKGDFCFAEDEVLEQFYSKIERVILCNWNQIKLAEIVGSSHEKKYNRGVGIKCSYYISVDVEEYLHLFL